MNCSLISHSNILHMPTSLPAARPPKDYIKLPGSERHPSKEATFLGLADDAEIVRLTIVLRRRADGPPMPDFDFYGNTPSHRREKLTPEDFAAKYGAHPEDIEQVVAFAEISGLTLVSTDAGTRTVLVSGTVARMSEAFAVPLGRFEVATDRGRKQKAFPKKETYRGRDGFIHVPEAIAPLLIGVFGLDNRNVTQPATQYADPPITDPITISQITELYRFPNPVPGISNQTIGIAALQGGYALPDLQTYFHSIGMKMPILHPVSADGTNGAWVLRTTFGANAWERTLAFASTEGLKGGDIGSFVVGGHSYGIEIIALTATTITVYMQVPGSNDYIDSVLGVDVPAETWVYFNVDFEVTQDICIAASAAPGVSINIYYAEGNQAGWVALMHKALSFDQGGFRQPNFNRPSVISSSFVIKGGDDIIGQHESHTTVCFLKTMDMMYQDAAAQMITVCNASGDYGSSGWIFDGIAHVSFPSTDPWVLSVGGTTVGKYQPKRQREEPDWVEYVWNEIYEYIQLATGGGVSGFFSLPSYQQNAGVPNSIDPKALDFPRTGRGVPDVAANASIFGGYLITVAGLPFIANGTSASTPLWAALIAIINANLGYDVGFVNSFLYTLGAGAFNPINPLWPDPAYPQLTDCPTSNGINGQVGYPARSGWDACTGWGSPNGTAILNAFKGI
jgi:subtilase family serine protease